MKTSLHIQNLKCGGCVKTITNKVSELENVSDVQVDKETSKVTFTHQKEEDVEVVTDKLKSLGYPTVDDENSVLTKAKSMFSCASGKI